MLPETKTQPMLSPVYLSEDLFSGSDKMLFDEVVGPWFREPSSRFGDLVCFSVAMVVVILYGPVLAHKHTLSELMAMRFSMPNLISGAVCILVWHVLLNVTRLPRRPRTLRRHIVGLALQTVACTGPAGFLLLLRHKSLANYTSAALFAAVSFMLLVLVRLVYGFYRRTVAPFTRSPRCAVIVGSGWRGQMLAQKMRHHPRWRYRLHGFIDSKPPEAVLGYLGTIHELETVLMSNAVDEVIITLPVKSCYDDIQESISVCERVGVQVSFSTDLFSTRITKRRSLDEDHPSSVLLHVIHNETGRTLKRALDIVVSVGVLTLLGPVLLFVALGIAFTSKGPIIFRQQRFGLNRRVFTMFKFRSMVSDAERRQDALEHLNETSGPVFKIKHDPRITPIGRFIRKTSIDELPQLWNVLRGDMSIVGPRPLPMRDVSRFTEAWLMRRFSVSPGITGLWQVSGRSKTGFDDLIRLDLEYIDRWSFFSDLKIIAKTVPAVLKGSGAS